MSNINVRVLEQEEDSKDNKRFEVDTQKVETQSYTIAQLKAQKEMLIKDKETMIESLDNEIAKIDAIITEANKKL